MIIDDYAVCEITVRRVSAGVQHSTDDGLTMSIGGNRSSARMVVPIAEGYTFRIGSNISYYENKETDQRTIQGERSTIETGFAVKIYASRISDDAMRINGTVQISAQIGQTLDTSSTSLPFDLSLWMNESVPICRVVVASAELAASLRTLTGAAVAAGDVVELVVRLR